jgi:hypothetical protein
MNETAPEEIGAPAANVGEAPETSGSEQLTATMAVLLVVLNFLL